MTYEVTVRRTVVHDVKILVDAFDEEAAQSKAVVIARADKGLEWDLQEEEHDPIEVSET